MIGLHERKAQYSSDEDVTGRLDQAYGIFYAPPQIAGARKVLGDVTEDNCVESLCLQTVEVMCSLFLNPDP